MTRDRQDNILLLANINAAIGVKPYCRRFHVSTSDVQESRAALRLDDPKLDALIRQGAHKRPWSKEAVRA